jgi:hypothetical protein
MTLRRVLLLVAVLAPPLCGCAANLDLGILYAAPGKYDYLRCEDLPARLAGALGREKQLVDLMNRANQDVAGPVVNVVTYSADLAQVRADIKILRQAAVDKKCGNIEPPEPKAEAKPPETKPGQKPR